MPTINKEKLNEYLNTKQNPVLAIFKVIQEIRKHIEESIAEMRREIKQSIEDKAKSLEERVEEKIIKSIDTKVGAEMEKSVQEKVSRNIFKGISQIKGDMGNTGETGVKGDTGQVGPTGTDGKDGIDGKDGKDGRDGTNGYAPQKGKDYSTDKDIRELVRKVEESTNVKMLLKEIQNIRKLFEEVKRDMRFAGRQRTLHRGGVELNYGEVPSGTVNGTNKVFTLANTPRNATAEAVYVNGVRQKRGGEDYAFSGSTITFVTAPPSNSLILVDYQSN